jgi:hypothetical protein
VSCAVAHELKIHKLALMSDDLPNGSRDFNWCRRVLSFVPIRRFSLTNLPSSGEKEAWCS